MRTTLRINDELLRRAKMHAAKRGTTLTALVEDSLRLALGRAERGPNGPVDLPVCSAGGGLRQDVAFDPALRQINHSLDEQYDQKKLRR